MNGDSTHGCGSQCDGCSGGACASASADEAPAEAALVPPIRVLAEDATIAGVRAKATALRLPDGAAGLMVTVGTRRLTILAREGGGEGDSSCVGREGEKVRFDLALTPAQAFAIRWLVTGEGLG